MFNYKNITRSIESSVVGSVFIIAGLFTALTGKSTWTESIVIISLGISFLFKKDNTNINNSIFLLLSLFLFMSCSPTQRFSHLIKKYPYLVSKDSIFKTDTCFSVSHEMKFDTFFKPGQFDTFSIIKDHIIFKMIKFPDDGFKIKIKTIPDTIIKKVSIPVFTIQRKITKMDALELCLFWPFITLSLVLFLISYALYKSKFSSK